MATENKKLLSFGKKYADEYKHLNKQKNASQYVAELIRKDMANDDIVQDLSGYDKIKQALRDVLDEYEFGIVANKKEEDPDYSDKINDLFNV